MKVGFIGLGNMGQPMANNLLKAGIDLWVYTRTRAKVDAMVARGAKGASSPADLTRQVDLVLTCLPDVRTSEEVFLGRDGVLSAARPGQVLADHSTVGPSTSRKIYQAAREKGVSFLDAPISGGPDGAAAGTLSIMVGGDADAFEKARPAFQAMGKTIMHMGPSGAGTITKLVNNLLVGIHTVASCEALLMGAKGGVDLTKLVEVLRNSWGASRMLERNSPFIINRNFGPSRAPMRNLTKDMGIIVKLAQEMGMPLPSGRVAAKLSKLADKKGWAENDITAIYLLLEQGEVK